MTPATGATSTLALSSAPRAADYAFAQGYLWGIGSAGIVRIDPATGTVSDFPIPSGLLPGAPNTIFGAAWTHGNGNLGFSNNSSGSIYQIAVSGASSAKPSFSLVSNQPGPANSINDGASIPGLPADLALSKSASPTAVASGDQLTYTPTVTNNGPGNSSGYVLDDPLPAGLGNPQTTTPGCSVATGDLVCQGNPLAVGATATITLTATALAPGDATDVSVSDPLPSGETSVSADPAQGSCSARPVSSECTPPIPVSAPAPIPTPRSTQPVSDLQIVKRVDHARARPGQLLTYTLLITNHGPDSASGIVVTDTPRIALAGEPATPSHGSCAAGRPLRCSVGTIAAGAAARIVVTGKVMKPGTEVNAASVTSTSTDPDPANNISRATTSIVAPASVLRLRKTASPTRISAGGRVGYRITVTASHAAARDIRVCDALPLGLTFLGANPAAALSNGRECWTIHRLGAGHSRTIVLRARALPSTRRTLVNHASARAAGTRTVHARAKVIVTRSAASARPPAGGVTG